jgi:hypothetical protein
MYLLKYLGLLSAFIMFVILQFGILNKPDDWVSILLAAGNGFFTIPTTSLYMAYSSEVVFPLGEGSATGYLFAASQTFGFFAGLGSAALVKSANEDNLYTKSESLWKIYLFMGLHALFFLIAFINGTFMKNKLNRTKY